MRANTDWFRDAKWGIFLHYLADAPSAAALPGGLDAAAWNRRVDRFDTARLSAQLEATGARYVFFTVGQNAGFYCAPNATYDSFVGVAPSKCAQRDLIADLSDALAPRGIRLLVYLPSGAPANDPAAVEQLEWAWGFHGQHPSWPANWPFDDGAMRTGERLAAFQVKWEAVIREWSMRWGEKVAGWWIDGCYFADAMYRHDDAPNFASFAAALKAGNPGSIVAFNPGVLLPVISMTGYEDYTAGEISTAFPVADGAHPLSRWVDGAQFHILSYLGDRWGGGAPRFPGAWVVAYTRYINAREGVVSWDVPITPEGVIPQPFIEQLALLGKV